jgi:hypothetical protein
MLNSRITPLKLHRDVGLLCRAENGPTRDESGLHERLMSSYDGSPRIERMAIPCPLRIAKPRPERHLSGGPGALS